MRYQQKKSSSGQNTVQEGQDGHGHTEEGRERESIGDSENSHGRRAGGLQ